MKNKFKNSTFAEGFVYSHKLEKRVTGEQSKNPGQTYIRGSIDVATNDDCNNIVTFNFTYVTPTTNTGAKNATYSVLEDVITGAIKNVMTDGKENAGKVRIDSAFALNEWYNTKEKDCPLVSTLRNEGGFVHQIETLNPEEEKRTKFSADMVVTKARRVEANAEKGEPEKVIASGYIFNFKNEIMPVEFTVLENDAMNYFEDMEKPFFTEVRGIQQSLVLKREVREESAFGEDSVREVTTNKKAFVINWGRKEPYEWDSDTTITGADVKKLLSDREVYLATIKARQEEFQAQKAAPTPVKKAEFDF